MRRAGASLLLACCCLAPPRTRADVCGKPSKEKWEGECSASAVTHARKQTRRDARHAMRVDFDDQLLLHSANILPSPPQPTSCPACRSVRWQCPVAAGVTGCVLIAVGFAGGRLGRTTRQGLLRAGGRVKARGRGTNPAVRTCAALRGRGVSATGASRRGFCCCSPARLLPQFKNGRPVGWGIFTWTNGQRYEGEWKDGQPHGQVRVAARGDGADGGAATHAPVSPCTAAPLHYFGVCAESSSVRYARCTTRCRAYLRGGMAKGTRA